MFWRHINKNAINSLLLVCLFLAPYLRGLFYKEFFYPLVLFLFILFVFQIFLQKDYRVDKKAVLLLSAQCVISILSALFAVNSEEAVYGVFLDITLLILFLLVLNMNRLDKIYPALFLSGTGIALFNFIHAALTHVSTKGVRFGEIIPYPNTLAVFFFICSLAGMNISQDEALPLWKLILIKTAVWLNMAAMLFTLSRTMLVLSLFMYVLYLVLHQRGKTVLDFAVILFAAFLCSTIITYTYWQSLWFAFALPIYLISAYTYTYRAVISKNLHFALKVFALLLSAAAAVVLLIAFRQGEIYARLASINLNASELRERFAYYRDAVHIIRDYPLLGLGTGGWSSIQYTYQTALYAVNYVHSSIFQVALDHGCLGLIIFLSQIVLSFVYVVRSLKRNKDSESRNIVILIFTADLALLLHSLIDLDFQFPAVAMIFWINLAVLCGLAGNTRQYSGRMPLKLAISAAALAAVVFLIPLALSSIYYAQGVTYFKSGEYTTSERYLKKANYFYSTSSRVYSMLGKTSEKLYLAHPDENIKSACLMYYTEAWKFDRFNPDYPAGKVHICKLASDYEGIVQGYRELISKQPLLIEYYESLAKVLVEKAQQDYRMGRTEQATGAYKEVLQLEDEVRNARNKLSHYAFVSVHPARLEITPALADSISKARTFLEKDRDAGVKPIP